MLYTVMVDGPNMRYHDHFPNEGKMVDGLRRMLGRLDKYVLTDGNTEIRDGRAAVSVYHQNFALSPKYVSSLVEQAAVNDPASHALLANPGRVEQFDFRPGLTQLRIEIPHPSTFDDPAVGRWFFDIDDGMIQTKRLSMTNQDDVVHAGGQVSQAVLVTVDEADLADMPTGEIKFLGAIRIRFPGKDHRRISCWYSRGQG